MGENKGKGLVVLVVGIIFVIIVIWLLTQKKKKDGDNGDGGNGDQVKPDGPSLSWHDYDPIGTVERWIGRPAQDHWVRLQYRKPTPTNPIGGWNFWIFPHPGGNPYTGAGEQIGIGGTNDTLGDLQSAVRNSWRANKDYPESRQWLDLMVENVLPGYGYDVDGGA